ncbi:putative serine/threonine protein kinase [Nocardia nova SH22a]|uniref:non-specific serine/threonine protein kinase n=1 Tax=Nocardia nova SH22a TaxID=1415166 RepID=W5TBY3_9NOCA|nr:serine/threonine-protein kinase [Nocardia nova]AHH16684.1 putative serine/threonine protein kinase [Nocardia nova SH22a]
MTETLLPGTIFAGYRIERVLGAGGMGTVYLATHPRLPRREAVKVLPERLGAEPEYRARFVREAEVASRLDHPNVVAVGDRGAERGCLWIAMQFVDGIDAARLIRRNPDGVAPPAAVHIVTEAARGLDAAHGAGLLHRDVKPANLLLESRPGRPDRVYVSDFGIARAASDAVSLTEPGAVIATVAYAAPEQIALDAVDHRADVYALGCTLYELLTGAKPFPRPTAAAVMYAHLTDPPPRPTSRNQALPAAIDVVIARALAKDPGHRFPSCGALAQAAAAAIGGIAPPVAVPGPAARPVRRRAPRTRRRSRVRVAAIAGVCAVVLAVSVGVVLATRNSGNPPSAGQTSAPTTPAGPNTASWGPEEDAVRALPRLLPATPTSSGYQGLRCSAGAVSEQSGAGSQMLCQGDRNPVDELVVQCTTGHTPMTIHPLDGVSAQGDQRWERTSGTGRTVWGNGTRQGRPVGVLQIGFDDPARDFCQILLWGGASGQDLMDRWWPDAPL